MDDRIGLRFHVNSTDVAFRHCSTVCYYDGGIALAFYGGTGECHDDQKVFLLFVSKDGIVKQSFLDYKTGNPVLWAENDKLKP